MQIMELYMRLATASPEAETAAGGLGFLDGSKPLLEMDLVIQPPQQSSGGGGPQRRGKAPKTSVKEVMIPLVVQQDLTALKGRKGDTGERSVSQMIVAQTRRQRTVAQQVGCTVEVS